MDVLKAEVEELRLATQGKGVFAGGTLFDSEEEIVALLVSEGVDAKKCLGAVVDFVSFFAHEKDGRVDENKMTNEMKQMQMAGIDNVASLRFINSFRHMQPGYFLNSSNTLMRTKPRGKAAV